MLNVGDSAPSFSVPAHDGTTVSLSDFSDDEKIVLWFYPKADTGG